MSINFLTFKQNTYDGQIISQPISIGAQGGGPPRPPQMVRMAIEWAKYGANAQNQQIGISANLFAQGQTSSPLDFIRSVFIDNTYVSVPVYVQFPDTLATYLCPAFGQAMHPVFTYTQTFNIYGDGFQDGDVSTTNLFFSNIDRHGYYVPATTGGNSGAPLVPVILTRTANPAVNSAGNINFPDVAFGDVDVDRVMALAITTSRSSGGTLVIDSVNIGGIAAVLQSKASIGSGVTINTSAEIWSCKVPTGTSGPILINVSGAGTIFLQSSLYNMRNLQSEIPLDAAQRTAGNNANLLAGINGGANGIILACASNLGGGFGWQNVQQNLVALQQTAGTASFYGSTASLLTSLNGNVNVGAVARALAVVSWQ